MIVDYHMHLRGPSEGREGALQLTAAAVERLVEYAAANGVDEIGVTEHVYYFRDFAPLISHPYQLGKIGYELDSYCDAVLEAKRRGLPVKLSLEVEHFPGREVELAEILAPYPWDYLLGSVHLLDGEAIDLEPGAWERLPVEEVWRGYFAALSDLASSGLFDVVAHPDLVKIFGRRPGAEEVGALHERAADAIADAGAAIEVSTAGLRKPVGELYPDEAFLAACRERGIPVTIAADAHRAQDVGRDFDQALALLRRVGYTTVSVYDGRRRHQEPLG